MKYEIKGGNLPVVVCKLENGESMITEGGSMVWMSKNFNMETSAGGFGKALGKIFSGEKVFQNIYTSEGNNEEIAFAASFPGQILAVEVTPDKPVILQKQAFLAATSGLELSVHLQKKLGTGLFGGEGFIMQKVSGSGTLFIEIDGSVEEKVLQSGESIVISTGYLAMMDSTCNMDIESIKGAKNVLFGGQGLFNTVVQGPGRVMIQSMSKTVFEHEIAEKAASMASSNK